MAEIEINVMESQCLDRRIDNIETVRSEVAAWQARRDNLHAKVNWQFTTKDARVKLKRLYPTTTLGPAVAMPGTFSIAAAKAAALTGRFGRRVRAFAGNGLKLRSFFDWQGEPFSVSFPHCQRHKVRDVAWVNAQAIFS